MAIDATPPAGILPRFSLLIEEIKRGLGHGIDRLRRIGSMEPRLSPLADLLWRYLARTMVRLTALHARFAAGELPRVPRHRDVARPAAERPRAEPPPAIPRGPVFLRYGVGYFAPQLRELLDHPETRALLAASPQAGRLLRPLWRKLTTDPLPDVLREPPRPRKPKAKPAAVAPAQFPAPSADARTLWEPTPCFGLWPPPLSPAPARAAELSAPTRPPSAALPPTLERSAPPAKPRVSPPPWLGLRFQR